MAGWQKSLFGHPDAPVTDPFDLKETDIARFVEQAYAITDRLSSVEREKESELGAARRQIKELQEQVGHLKNRLKKYDDEELKARQERNQQLQHAKEQKTSEALSTHKLSNGVCAVCGLSADLISGARIFCDGLKLEPKAN